MYGGEEMMHGYQLFLQELQETTFNREVDRARERWFYENYDIGQLKNVEQQRKRMLGKEELTTKVEWEDYK
jgi:hypothetical protein